MSCIGRLHNIMKKNILILEGRETIGGGQIITKKIYKILSESNNVSVFIPGEKNAISDYLSEYRIFNYKIKEYTRGKKKNKDYIYFIYNFFSTYMSLYKVLNNNHFDIIYIQHQNVLPVAVFVNMIFKKTVIAHLHVVYVDKVTRLVINKCLQNKYIRKIIGVSNYTLQQLNSSNKSKSLVIYNPISSQKKVKDKKYSYQIAIVGDVINNKGHHLLFESLMNYSSKYTVHIVGNIIDEKYYESLKNKYQSIDTIYTGMIDDVCKYLSRNKIDLVIVPSISPFETFSLSMVESWSMGIPTIATNAFGMKEIVNTFIPKYASQMLFNLSDSSDLIDKINELESNTSLYKEISDKTYKIVEEKLNYEIFSKSLNEIIESI